MSVSVGEVIGEDIWVVIVGSGNREGVLTLVDLQPINAKKQIPIISQSFIS